MAKAHMSKKGTRWWSSPGRNWASAAKSCIVNKKKQRVLVEGLHMIKRHTRKSQTTSPGRHRRARGHGPHFQRDAGRKI